MRRALIVGIDDYPGAGLSGCVNDANRLSAILARHDDDAPNVSCKTLTSPDDQLTRAVLRKHIEELFGQPADAALFYFSGHGTSNDLDGYIVTQDAHAYDEGVAMSDILNQANDAPIGEVVLVLDCCFSGTLGNVPIANNDAALLREGVSVLTASRSSELSYETNGSGVFTSLICDALMGGAADVLGRVTVPSIYAYVDQSLGAWDQRPLFKSHVSRLLPLRHCRPSIALETLRMLPAYFTTSTAEYPLDPSYEPLAEPQHDDHERIFANLQKFRAARLLEPVGEEHMYFAAMNLKACRLTPAGRLYWQLAGDGQL
jgi:hypothetical protein